MQGIWVVTPTNILPGNLFTREYHKYWNFHFCLSLSLSTASIKIIKIHTNNIGMLEKPTGGQVFYKGESIEDIYGETLARIRRTEIAFIFQDYYLMDSLTVKENIMLPLILNEENISRSETLLSFL